MKRTTPSAAQLQGARISTRSDQLITASKFLELWGDAKTRSRERVIGFIKSTYTWSDELAAARLNLLTERPALYQNGTSNLTWFMLRPRGRDRYELVRGSLNGQA